MSQRKYNKTKIESIKRTKRITLPIGLTAYEVNGCFSPRQMVEVTNPLR